ncbi:MAG: MFS transporter [Firmicutes bacterium]|nr:MFS transporter [Bacillota bacterium]
MTPLKKLQTARTIRSIGQGIAVVDLTLYLRALGWSAPAIGGVLTGAALAGSALMLAVGYLSDRRGRKPFLAAYECVTAVSALGLALTHNPWILTLAIVLTGFGRGQNGAAGPFTPAEQAWMVRYIPPRRRSQVLSVNTALGFFGMALGALLAGAAHVWRPWFPGPERFAPLFALIALLSLVTAALVMTTPEERSEKRSPAESNSRETRTVVRRENRDLAKLALINGFNGLAVGLFGPLMSYWFSARFHASSTAIAASLSLSLAVTGVASLASGHLAQKVGTIRAIVWLQIVGVLLTMAIPWMPTFLWASVLYTLRSAFSRSTQGVRSALSTSLTRDERRGLAVSINSLSMRLPSAIGPTIAGYLLENGDFGLPFVLGGLLQLASTLSYRWFFARVDEDQRGSLGGGSQASNPPSHAASTK